jgi:hypothetical protein
MPHCIVLLIIFYLNLNFKFKFKCIWIAFIFPLFLLLGRPISLSSFSFSFSLHGPAFCGQAGPALSLPFLPPRSPAGPAFFFSLAQSLACLGGPAAHAPSPRPRLLPASLSRTNRRGPPVRPFFLPPRRTRTRTRVRLAPVPSPLQSVSGTHAHEPPLPLFKAWTRALAASTRSRRCLNTQNPSPES